VGENQIQTSKGVSAKFTANSAKTDSASQTPTAPLWKERQLWDYRRANNLCYFCRDKFDVNHLQKCTKRTKPHLNVLALNDLDAELLNQLEVEDVLVAEMEQLSLNAIVGTESKDSMRIRALVHNKVMLILVDSGSSHSLSANPLLHILVFRQHQPNLFRLGWLMEKPCCLPLESVSWSGGHKAILSIQT
jgi:hypothetical protein